MGRKESKKKILHLIFIAIFVEQVEEKIKYEAVQKHFFAFSQWVQ